MICGPTAQQPSISASTTCMTAGDGVESTTGAVAVGPEEWLFAGSFRTLPVPQFGPWLRFQSPLVKPDVRICRVAQPLLAFAPTDPTMRRYRSGLFRKDPRRVDHCCHAWWIAGSGRGKAVRSWR